MPDLPSRRSGTASSAREGQARRLKVVFDAYWWVNGPPSLRHVLREIVAAWQSNFPHDELTLVVRRGITASTEGIATVESRLWPQALLATRAVPRVARSIGADLVLTHNFAARYSEGVSAIYLHDVLFETNPEWFSATERRYFSLMTRWARRADLVFTSSETEAERIREHTDAQRVLAVGLGMSHELMAIGEPDDPDPALYGMRFVLTVGRLNIRKNLGRVIRAALASSSVTIDRPLVIVGSANGKEEGLDVAAREAVATGRIRFTGFVSEERLRWYYKHTSLFVFLSLGEGFGMPPIEAAYFSATVLASDLPVFHETLGDSASFVDPTDEAAITAALDAGVVAGESRGADRRPRGSVAARHDWSETVGAMRAAVETVAS